MSRRKGTSTTRPSESNSKTQKHIKPAKDDLIDEASRESFPASDAPAWTIPTRRKQKS